MNFGYNKADGETKNDRYKAALKKFVDEWADHEVSAAVRAYWTGLLQEKSEFVDARQEDGGDGQPRDEVP